MQPCRTPCSAARKGPCSAMEISPEQRLTGPRAVSLASSLLPGVVTKQEGSLRKCCIAAGLLKCKYEFERRILKEFSCFACRVYCLLMLQSEKH